MRALLIFDIDGTLLDTRTVTVPAVRETFVHYGLGRPSSATICAFFGRPVEEYEAWIAAQCPPKKAPEIVEATNARELETLRQNGQLYEGVEAMIADLHAAGYAMALCSNGPEAYVQAFVEIHPFGNLFQAVRARGFKYPGKTEMVCEILGLIQARPVVVIGDRADDIDAAHANGAKAVAASYGFGSPEEHAGADAVAAAPAEVPGCISEVIGR